MPVEHLDLLFLKNFRAPLPRIQSHLAERCEVAVFALHQELRRDVSRWLHFAGLLVLLMELLDPLLSGHQLHGKKKARSCVKGHDSSRRTTSDSAGQRPGERRLLLALTLLRRSLSSSWVLTIFFQCSICSSLTCFSCSLQQHRRMNTLKCCSSKNSLWRQRYHIHSPPSSL